MPHIIAFITLIFIFIAFLSHAALDKTLNPFVSYFSSEIHFISVYRLVFILGFVVLTFLFLRIKHFDTKHPFHKKYFLTTMHLLQFTLVGFLLAYVILFVIAFVQLNVSAVLLNTSPKVLGVVSDRKTVLNNLKIMSAPPVIVTTDTDQQKEAFAVAGATAGSDTYYGMFILPSIPDFLVIPVKKPPSSILLVDNTLIVTEMNPHDLQAVSPEIAYLFLKQYFWGRSIKAYPKVSIMSQDEYLTFRQTDTKKKIAAIDGTIQRITGDISSISAKLEEDKASYLDLTDTLDQTTAKRDRDYKTCLSGNALLVTCKKLKSQFDATIQQQTKADEDIHTQIQFAEKQLPEYKYYQDFFTAQKKVLQSLKGSLPYELGLFEPKDTIKMVVDTENSPTLADYFESFTHEYLHYASYVSDKSVFADSFFEEGLTEYFARNIIKDNFNTDTNIGYPVQVKIIQEITKSIPEAELADIYFTKDQNRLEATLDRVYGANFYKNTRLLFETLMYSSTPNQILKPANEIMTRIRGNNLNEKDLFSNFGN